MLRLSKCNGDQDKPLKHYHNLAQNFKVFFPYYTTIMKYGDEAGGIFQMSSS